MTEVYRRIRTAQGMRDDGARLRDAAEAEVLAARVNGNDELADKLGRELATKREGRGPQAVRRNAYQDPNLPPRELAGRTRFEY